MLDKYIELNDDSKRKFIDIISKMNLSSVDKDRCLKEIDLLYNKGILFFIYTLYCFKKDNKEISYHFRGTINNLLVLYKLGLTYVDPIKYNLPYELFNDSTINVDLIDAFSHDLIWYIEKSENEYRIFYGNHEKEDIPEIDEYEDNHYLIIPSICNPKNMTFKLNNGIFETTDDYSKYREEYLVVRIDEKYGIVNKEISIKNALKSKFEINLSSKLKPKSIEDYAKIVSLAHGTNLWNNNEDMYYKTGKININNIISSREDIYEYLLEHGFSKEEALELTNTIRKNDRKDWNKYEKIMKEHQCDELYIDIFKNIEYISGRGQAISECLFANNKDNYIEL